MPTFPARQNGQLKYCASNQVGDAAMLDVGFILIVPVSFITAGLLLVWERWRPTGTTSGKKAVVCGESPLNHQI